MSLFWDLKKKMKPGEKSLFNPFKNSLRKFLFFFFFIASTYTHSPLSDTCLSDLSVMPSAHWRRNTTTETNTWTSSSLTSGVSVCSVSFTKNCLCLWLVWAKGAQTTHLKCKPWNCCSVQYTQQVLIGLLISTTNSAIYLSDAEISGLHSHFVLCSPNVLLFSDKGWWCSWVIDMMWCFVLSKANFTAVLLLQYFGHCKLYLSGCCWYCFCCKESSIKEIPIDSPVLLEIVCFSESFFQSILSGNSIMFLKVIVFKMSKTTHWLSSSVNW